MSIKCRNCPDVKYKYCPAPNVLANGKLYCEQGKGKTEAICDHCGDNLRLGHFAYEPNWKEFWCEDCLLELLQEVDK